MYILSMCTLWFEYVISEALEDAITDDSVFNVRSVSLLNEVFLLGQGYISIDDYIVKRWVVIV